MSISDIQETFPEWKDILSIKESKKNEEYSIKHILSNGINLKKIKAEAPKHFSTALNQIVFSDVRTLESFDTLLSPYVKNDKLTDYQLEQQLQAFVYSMSFYRQKKVYLQLDSFCPDFFKNQKISIAGKELEYTYSNCQNEISKIGIFLRKVLSNNSDLNKENFVITLEKDKENISWDEFSEINGITYEMYIRDDNKSQPIKDFLALSSLSGKEIDIGTESGLKTASEHGVFSAPTIILYNVNNEEIDRIHSINEIQSTLILLKNKENT